MFRNLASISTIVALVTALTGPHLVCGIAIAAILGFTALSWIEHDRAELRAARASECALRHFWEVGEDVRERAAERLRQPPEVPPSVDFLARKVYPN
jgi:hypothetical protein